MKMVLVLYNVELELHIVLRLFLNEVRDYVKHVKLCNLMNEGLKNL